MELGSLATARRAFQRILDTYPTHTLAPAARFYIADILTQEGRYEEALDEFLLIRQEHPADPKVPEGLYRAALLQIERLDRRDDGLQNLRLMVNSYPDSDYADLAQQKLDELGR
jgi:TolA-binding protein